MSARYEPPLCRAVFSCQPLRASLALAPAAIPTTGQEEVVVPAGNDVVANQTNRFRPGTALTNQPRNSLAKRRLYGEAEDPRCKGGGIEQGTCRRTG